MSTCGICGELTTKKEIHFCQCPDGQCQPKKYLEKLHVQKKLTSFLKALNEQVNQYIKENIMDCHTVTQELLLAIINEGTGGEWLWCHGYIKGEWTDLIMHSWLESDGWAIDAAFKHNTVLVMNVANYESLFRVKFVEKMPALDALRLWTTSRKMDEWRATQETRLEEMNSSRHTAVTRQLTKPNPRSWWKFW